MGETTNSKENTLRVSTSDVSYPKDYKTREEKIEDKCNSWDDEKEEEKQHQEMEMTKRILNLEIRKNLGRRKRNDLMKSVRK